jgi:hypothetical protein
MNLRAQAKERIAGSTGHAGRNELLHKRYINEIRVARGGVFGKKLLMKP